MLQLLACCTRAEHPVVLFVTDGSRYHRLRLRGKGLRICRDLEPYVAIYNMVTILKQVGLKCPTEPAPILTGCSHAGACYSGHGCLHHHGSSGHPAFILPADVNQCESC